ncbi:hypothetical protein CRUP_029722 [Coryphaenoides rupestris]|nr:hypothetical protein CRUP_029722 [Coryphaenoides rupestris]
MQQTDRRTGWEGGDSVGRLEPGRAGPLSGGQKVRLQPGNQPSPGTQEQLFGTECRLGGEQRLWGALLLLLFPRSLVAAQFLRRRRLGPSALTPTWESQQSGEEAEDAFIIISSMPRSTMFWICRYPAVYMSTSCSLVAMLKGQDLLETRGRDRGRELKHHLGRGGLRRGAEQVPEVERGGGQHGAVGLEGLALHQDGHVTVVAQQALLVQTPQDTAAKVRDFHLQQPLRHAVGIHIKISIKHNLVFQKKNNKTINKRLERILKKKKSSMSIRQEQT